MSLPSTRPASFCLTLKSGTHAYLCADCKAHCTRTGAAPAASGVVPFTSADVLAVTPAPADAVCVWCE